MQRVSSLILALAGAATMFGQEPGTGRPSSAPIRDIRYEITFDRAAAAERVMRVVMTFTTNAGSRDPILLSLPAWTPGSYEIDNFARWVVGFSATMGGKAITWDKLDYDTWRIRRDPTVPGDTVVRVAFEYRADTLDNAMSWSRRDFLLFNGTNVFMYPEGRPLDFAARVRVNTESDWKVTTSMRREASVAGSTFSASNYHDLVDMPFFVGRFDVDSALVGGKWMRFASYPSGAVRGAARALVWDQLKKAVPPQIAVFGEVPWETYSVMQIVDSAYQGASGLEHSSSHVDVLSPLYVGSDFQPSLYAHEIFHAWNVKRLRPMDLWPYRYDAPQPTTWLWVSEGITDYYADLSEVRGGIVSDSAFYALTSAKLNEMDAIGPVALEDASLNTWVHPVDGSEYSYYGKGSLAGFMLDIIIRDASDNRQSLDDVMRALYAGTYKQGRGFTRDDWWAAVSRAAGGRSFAEFERKYVDGREPYPWIDILPLAGLRTAVARVPRLGIATRQDSAGILIEEMEATSPAAAAGIRSGDYLLAINDILVTDPGFAPRFRAEFANAREGQPVRIRVSRGGATLTFTAPLRMAAGETVIVPDPSASPKALRIRNGILRGTTDR